MLFWVTPAISLLLLARKGQTNKRRAETRAANKEASRRTSASRGPCKNSRAEAFIFSTPGEPGRHLHGDERPNHSYENDMFVKIPRYMRTRPQTDAVEPILLCVCVTAI